MQTVTGGAEIEYYFSTPSSFAYLGHVAFRDMVERLSLKVTYRPVKLAKIFLNSGSVSFADRHPARGRYRMLELQRWRVRRGLEMNLRPKFFPADGTLSDCVVIALQNEGRDPYPYLTAAMRKVWVEDGNIADPMVIGDCLTACGEDREAILRLARSEEVAAEYEANVERGLKHDILGSPCIVYQGESFWGQDRFDFAEEAITSGRAPYSSGL